jgi:hypothetical protein
MGKGEGDAPFTILSERHKKWTIAITSLVTFVSPVSANIYYPALNEMASELGTTSSKINLTITAFMVGPDRDVDRFNFALTHFLCCCSCRLSKV